MEKIQKLEEQVLDKISEFDFLDITVFHKCRFLTFCIFFNIHIFLPHTTTTDIESQLSKQKETNKELDGTILALNKHLTKKDLKISQLDEQLTEAQSQTKLAEKQYDGLKETIRRLQEDNDTCKKQYEEIEGRIMTEKEKSVDLMNKMNGENEELKKKIEMLTQLNQQEKKRFLWSAKGHHHNIKNKKGGVENVNLDDEESEQSNRKFGTSGVVVPSKILQRISAHQRQATSLR